MVVISVSLSGDELNRFDKVVDQLNFSSRSDAVRSALHEFIAKHSWEQDIHRDLPFITTIIYPNRKESAVHEVLHEFDDLIITATHTHLSAENCVEWVILEGGYQEVDAFVQELFSIKNVKLCRCSV